MVEGLDRRDVPSAFGATTPFATLSGAVTRPGRPAAVTFQIEPGNIVSDRSIPMLVNLDAVPAPGSTLVPRVTKIVSLSGRQTRAVAERQGSLVTGVAIPVTEPAVYSIRVAGRLGTTGAFTVNVALPGDTNGDGSVDRTDLARVRAAYGSRAGGPRYDPAADFNHDGRVGHIDLGLTRRNLGSVARVVVIAPSSRPA